MGSRYQSQILYRISKVKKSIVFMIKWFRKHFKLIFSILIIGAVVYFFSTEFKKNWQDIQDMDLKLNIPFMCASLLIIALSYLINTMTWRYLINSYHRELQRISIKESIAIVNTTQLAKYIPGKVWSYAVQIFWLAKRGYSKSNVLFINVVATLSTLMAASAVGTVMLATTMAKISRNGAIFYIGMIILAYAVFILFHTPILNFLIRLANKIIKKEISYVNISLKQILVTQLLYLLGNVVFCIGGYLLCFAIGIDSDFKLMTVLVGSLLVGDVVGFVVLIVPGGLGVRESLMFFIITGVTKQKDIATVVPVATRLLTMSVDIAMGLLGLMLGRNTVINPRNVTQAENPQ